MVLYVTFEVNMDDTESFHTFNSTVTKQSRSADENCESSSELEDIVLRLLFHLKVVFFPHRQNLISEIKK